MKGFELTAEFYATHNYVLGEVKCSWQFQFPDWRYMVPGAVTSAVVVVSARRLMKDAV
jgi:hypothetical protein